MDESTPNPQPEPRPSPEAVPGRPYAAPPEPERPAEGHAPSPRRVKRRLLAWLIGLNAAALLAACVLILRAKNGLPPSGEARAKALLALSPGDSVGWVSIRGPIYPSSSGKPWDHGAERWVQSINDLADTKGVKAIVLDINTPGGSVGSVQEIHSAIERVRREKHIPFVADFGDVAASGGYYVASACDKIVAHPGTLTGSIGVIFEYTNMQGLFSKIGFKMEPIKSGPHKDIGSPGRAMTPVERRIMQTLIDDAYGQFVAAVAAGRHMSVAAVRKLADGRVYSGDQALANGLVDQLGDSHDALMLAAKLGGIKSPHPRVRRSGDQISNLFQMLESRTRVALGMGPIRLPLPEAALAGSSHGLLYMWPGW
jgi:protease IV